MFWELYLSQSIYQTESKASNASSRAGMNKQQLQVIERRLEALSLACQSMWELVRERTEITEQDLVEKILEVDLRDGKADGRMKEVIRKCENCQRNTPQSRKTCLYCSTELPSDQHIFSV